MNGTNLRERAERTEIIPGDEVLLKLADFAGTFRFETVAETGYDLIRDEAYIILDGAPGRIFASDVVHISRVR